MRLLGVVLFGVAIAFSAGCSGDDGQQRTATSPSATTSASTGSMSPTVVSTSSPTATKHSIAGPTVLVMECEFTSGVTLKWLSLSTGEITKSFAVLRQPSSPQNLALEQACDKQGGQRVLTRQIFNADFTRMAVSNGADGVGYIDVNSGVFTNITENYDSQGFRATSGKATHPIFDPHTGRLVFVWNNTEILEYDPATRVSGQTRHHLAWSRYTDGITIQSGMIVDPSYLLSPDGRLAVAEDQGNQQLQLVQNGRWHRPQQLQLLTEAGKTLQCTIQQWVNNHELLCVAHPEQHQLYVVSLPPAEKRVSTRRDPIEVRAKPVLPANQWANTNMLLSSNGSQLVFDSRQTSTNTCTLYRSSWPIGKSVPTATPVTRPCSVPWALLAYVP